MSSDGSLNVAWAGSAGFGAKMLAKMGWKGRGAGLGKNEDGAAEHLTVKRRPEGAALGTDTTVGGNVALAAAVQDFNAVLAAVAATTAGAAAAAAATAARSAVSTSASAGGDSGVGGGSEDERAVRRAAKRRRRDERAATAAAAAGGNDADDAGDAARAPADVTRVPADTAPPAEPERVVSRARANYGRYHRGKNAAASSREDMAAILGGSAM